MSAGPPEDFAVHQTSPFAVVYGALYERHQSSFVTVEIAAEELNIHFTTARSWLSKGCFPVPTQTLGSRRVVALAGLADFIIRGAGLASIQSADATDQPAPLLPVVETTSNEPAAEQEQPPPQKRKPGRPRKTETASGKAVSHG